MLGIILIIAIGNFFFRLAREYNKSLWLFTILGIVSYYAGTLIAGFVIGLLVLRNEIEVNEGNYIFYGMASIPFGIISCAVFYFLLKKNWSKAKIARSDTLDADELWK
ncbi:MAG: hypothetical protein ACKVOK_15790 [Flavobacteriales bacterium]